MPIPAGSRYVAMGSSFAAGPGLPARVPGSPRPAGRSTGNYAHLVAGTLGLDLHDVTFSGATTGDILGPSAAGQPAQLDAVTSGTSLVTITAGGNDVGFLPRLTLASLPWPLRALPRARARVAGFGDARATDERFAQLERNLAAIAGRLHERAPDCRVLIVDYLTILPPDGDDRGAPPPPGIAVWGRALAARLAATTQAAAADAGWATSPPRPPPPVTTPGRRSRGRGASTCPCAAAPPTTRTRPAWRRSPGSSSPSWRRTASPWWRRRTASRSRSSTPRSDARPTMGMPCRGRTPVRALHRSSRCHRRGRAEPRW